MLEVRLITANASDGFFKFMANKDVEIQIKCHVNYEDEITVIENVGEEKVKYVIRGNFREKPSKAKRVAKELAELSTWYKVDDTWYDILLDIKKEIDKYNLFENQETEEEIPEADKEYAEQLQKNPKLLRILLDILKNKIVGEEKTALLIYLIATTAKMNEKVNAQVTGESSAGKTWITKSVLELLPEDHVYDFTRITKTALDHATEIDWSDKILFIGEAGGVVDALETIKMFTDNISGGSRLLIPEKDERTGKIKSVVKESKGLPVFITTTAKPLEDIELSTRLIIVPVDLSEEQTKRILQFQADKTKEPWKYKIDEEQLKDIKNAWKLLDKNVEVIIPYAESLAKHFPTSRIRARRDYLKLIWLIKASATLFQKQRYRIIKDDVEYIVADTQDFYNAYILSKEAMTSTLANLHKTTQELYDKLRNAYEVGDRFTIDDIINKKLVDLSRIQIRRHLNILFDFGILNKERVGVTNEYWLREEEIPTLKLKGIVKDMYKEIEEYAPLLDMDVRLDTQLEDDVSDWLDEKVNNLSGENAKSQ